MYLTIRPKKEFTVLNEVMEGIMCSKGNIFLNASRSISESLESMKTDIFSTLFINSDENAPKNIPDRCDAMRIH